MHVEGGRVGGRERGREGGGEREKEKKDREGFLRVGERRGQYMYK